MEKGIGILISWLVGIILFLIVANSNQWSVEGIIIALVLSFITGFFLYMYFRKEHFPTEGDLDGDIEWYRKEIENTKEEKANSICEFDKEMEKSREDLKRAIERKAKFRRENHE